MVADHSYRHRRDEGITTGVVTLSKFQSITCFIVLIWKTSVFARIRWFSSLLFKGIAKFQLAS
jgi:hypothetical protein